MLVKCLCFGILFRNVKILRNGEIFKKWGLVKDFEIIKGIVFRGEVVGFFGIIIC